jgi:hypothetical protein
MGLGRFLAGVLVVWGAASTLPGANVRVNVTGTPSEPFSQSESVIVQFNYNDPADLPNLGTQDVILVAWNDQSAPGGIGFGFARSVGGGAFEHTTLAGGGILPAPTGGQGLGDPLLAVDYHADLDGVGNPLVYAAQMDGGRTFPSSSTMNISNSPAPGCPSGSGVPKVCDDKPWIAIDQRGGARPADGTVYACWTRISSDGETVTNQVLLAQKPPGGTFGTPIAITPEVTYPANVQACQVAVDIDGHVYVAWREFDDRPKVMLRHAPAPAGAAVPVFDPEVLVDQIRTRLFRSDEEIVSCAAPEWLLRFAATFPSLATDPYDRNVYLTWGSWNGPTGGNGPARYDVFFTSLVRPGTRSDLRAPLRVNDDPVGDAVDQYMPSIATYPLPVAPTAIGGETTVMVQWYDKRSSGVGNDAFELWADQSPFNTNEPVSDAGPEPVNPPGSDMACRPGDYNAMTSGYFLDPGPDGTVPGPVFLHSWTDTRGAGADDRQHPAAQPVYPVSPGLSRYRVSDRNPLRHGVRKRRPRAAHDPVVAERSRPTRNQCRMESLAGGRLFRPTPTGPARAAPGCDGSRLQFAGAERAGHRAPAPLRRHRVCLARAADLLRANRCIRADGERGHRAGSAHRDAGR